MSDRQRDLLLTAVMLGILMTPAWLVPTWLSVPWQIGVGILALPALWFSWYHAPWQPTPRAELERILACLELDEDMAFCDLGAGDGRIVRWVAATTGARCVGIEASPLQWAVAQMRLVGSSAEVRLADLYSVDLREFDAVYVWGTAYSVGTARFAERVKTLKPGARLVSYGHPVYGLEPERVDETGQRPLFVYGVRT